MFGLGEFGLEGGGTDEIDRPDDVVGQYAERCFTTDFSKSSSEESATGGHSFYGSEGVFTVVADAGYPAIEMGCLLDDLSPPYFITERGGPATTAGFLKTIARLGEAAKLPFPIHPHMLRHSTGYKLANDGHDTRALQHFMGHRNIMHTVRYTEMAPDRFKNFWKD